MKRKIQFVGSFIENDVYELPVGCSFAGNYYQNKVRSIININHSISIIYGNNNIEYKSNDAILYIVLKKGRHFYNIISVIKQLLLLNKNVNVSDSILFYNINIYSLFYLAYYRLINRAKVIVLLADSGFLVENGILSLLLSKALTYSNGILSLREIPELRKMKTKIEIMPGIVSKEAFTFITSKRIENTVLLSGSLGITTGFILALEYFSTQSKLKLIITGVPYLISNLEFESILGKYESENISYLGVLGYKDYINILYSSEFSLSLRNPADVEHEYNFPSKILEYMSYGSLVISSIRYLELEDNIYYRTDYSIEGLELCFDKLSIATNQEKELVSMNAKEFVNKHCSEEVLITKINNLYSK